MADNGFNTSPFVLPNMFPAPGNVMQQLIGNKQRKEEREYEIDYRRQRDADADEWRKINLIQDLTDLSKHQTASDVANAIGNQQAATILQKYTAGANSMSAPELQARIAKDMQGTITGMTALQDEMNVSDEQIKVLKQQFPDLDISTLAKHHRAEILNRRLKGDQFVNPLEVGQSEFNVGDPEFLSRYVRGNKNLSQAIINPVGAETESVLMGKQGDYTKFEGKLPHWLDRDYDRNKFDSEGFYKDKKIPSFKLKATALPSDALPSSNNKPFNVVDKEVYDRFSQDGKTNLELIAATRSSFPEYDNFNPTEKEYAKRNVLYNQLKSLDQNQLHPTFSTKPARTTVNVGGSTKNAAADWVRRATEAAKSGDNQKIQDEFAQLLQGDKNLYESVTVDGGRLKVVFKSPKKTGILGQVIPEQPQTIEIDINDRYISQKLARVYQQIMGGDVNVERSQYQKSGKGSVTAPTTKNDPLGIR